MNPSEPAISLRKASCGYGRPMLSGITWDVPVGSAALLIGPNGSGKSTLLKALLGETLLDFESATVMGRPVPMLRGPELCRTIAYAPQAEAILFPFTAVEYVALGRSVLGTGYFPPPADVQLALEALAEIGAERLAYRPVTELSGGETHLVVIARALAQRTPILLLDEPLAHLDVAHWKMVLQTVHRRLSQRVAVVMALHDLNLAAQLRLPTYLVGGGSVRPVQLGDDSGLEAIRGAYGVSMTRRIHEGSTYLALTDLPCFDGPFPIPGTTTGPPSGNH